MAFASAVRAGHAVRGARGREARRSSDTRVALKDAHAWRASRARARGAHAWRAAMNPFDALRAARAESKQSVKPPMAQRALSKFLELPTVPIG